MKQKLSQKCNNWYKLLEKDLKNKRLIILGNVHKSAQFVRWPNNWNMSIKCVISTFGAIFRTIYIYTKLQNTSTNIATNNNTVNPILPNISRLSKCAVVHELWFKNGVHMISQNFYFQSHVKVYIPLHPMKFHQVDFFYK